MTLISVYRLQWIPIAEFWTEFADLLELFVVLNEDFVIAGDVNIHVESDECASRKFEELMELFDMRQQVVGPTHIMGHTIDVIITPNKCSYLSDVEVRKIDLSHHFLIDFKVSVDVMNISTKTITYRNLKNIDSVAFNNKITARYQACPVTIDLQTKVGHYNSILEETLNKHAPLKSKEIKLVNDSPWFDQEYVALRKQRRKAEKKFHKSGLLADKEKFVDLRKQTTELAKNKKLSYVSEKLESGTSKTLYSVVNQLIDNNKEVSLPSANSDVELAENFLKYFKEKIDKIRAKFPTYDHEAADPAPNANLKTLSTFRPTNAEELREIVSKFGTKCSPEDPVPSAVLATHLETLLPIWVDIVNLSLETGCMESLKNAVIIPLIKELHSTTDTDNNKNYRPVSNLVFISKLIERVVDIRLQEHLITNNLMTDKEYAYKKHHSTEMLLIKVVNDLLLSCDKNHPSVVLLLDLSAAFDTVDHRKLLNILHRDIGITGVALEWFKSYLINRTQKVKIGDSYSSTASLSYGVPQGSILGPRLFNIYIRSLYEYIKATKFEIEGFADDHQLIKSFLVAMQTVALGDDIRNCLNHISMWMNKHFLCLNETKTKILVVAPPGVKERILIGGVILENCCIRFVDSAKNLGVILDSFLSFETQVNKVVKTCFHIIRKLSKVKMFLSQLQLQILVSGQIFSNIDYCNALYYGLSANTIQKLQRVQNCAARLVMKNRVSFRMSLDGIFFKLHWLKVKFRIIYKILLVVHNCLHNNAPNEVAALLRYSDSERTMNLQEPRVLRGRYGDRAFSRAAPKMWNLLPDYVRDKHDTIQFKKQLKSFLITRDGVVRAVDKETMMHCYFLYFL